MLNTFKHEIGNVLSKKLQDNRERYNFFFYRIMYTGM